MHDRRIDGEANIFGNAGGLFMNAMTWWDHETDSIWSQPWGRAIQGELKGVELFLLPSQLTTWGAWREEHPETLAMVNQVAQTGFKQTFSPSFVIGLVLAGESRAFYYEDVKAAGLINDQIGETPIFVWAADNNFHAYVRKVAGPEGALSTLTFRLENGTLRDEETGSTWDVARGLAVEGPLSGQSLQPVPSSSAFDWAWRDFYPETTFYEP